MTMTDASVRRTDEAAELEAARRAATKRRTRWLLITIPFAIGAIALAWWLLGRQIVFWQGDADLKADDAASAAEHFSSLESFNAIQPHLAYYDTGTALLLDGRYSEAEEQLWLALDLTTERDRCAVSTNLALSLEAQGDEALLQGAAATAVNAYSLAKGVWDESTCPPEDQQEAQERLEQKESQAKEDQQNQQEGQGEGDPTPSPSPSDSEQQGKLGQLDQRNQDAQDYNSNDEFQDPFAPSPTPQKKW